jgi:hypothetical protein
VRPRFNTKMSAKKKAAAVDALFAAGVTSSDMEWLMEELKKRETKAAAAAEAAAAAAEARAAQGAAAAPAPPALKGKKATDAVKEVLKHTERLKYQDEDWKARDEALVRLQKLITEGALSCDGFVSGFDSNLKDLVHSLVAQLYDLRSVIVRSAVTTLKLLMTEVGDHADAERPFCGDVLEGLLQLASSGNKVLSAAGRETFPHLIDAVRFESMINASPQGLLHWLRGMKHVPVKMCCLSSLLQALQTWPASLLANSHGDIEVALVEAAAHSSGEVRAIARQCLLQHLLNEPKRQGEVDKWLARYPETKKQLGKEQLKPGGLSAAERVAPTIRHGESGAAVRNGKLGSGATPDAGDGAGAPRPKKPSLLKRLSTKSALKADPDAAPVKGGSVRDMAAMSAVERMQQLNERKGDMSEEEYNAERQKIIQAL